MTANVGIASLTPPACFFGNLSNWSITTHGCPLGLFTIGISIEPGGKMIFTSPGPGYISLPPPTSTIARFSSRLSMPRRPGKCEPSPSTMGADQVCGNESSLPMWSTANVVFME